MLKIHLKQICELEGEIEERTLKLGKAIEEYEKTQERISEEKERLNKILQDENAKVRELEQSRKSAANYYPKGVLSTAITFVIVMLITLLLGFGIKALVINVFKATEAASATEAYMVINILPIIILWLFACLIDSFTLKKLVTFIVIYIVITILTFFYFMYFEDKDKSISFAMMFFMGCLLSIELLSGIITCLVKNKQQKNEYIANRRWLVKSEKTLATLKENAEIANNNFSKYVVNSQKAEQLMNEDIQAQIRVLDDKKLYLKNLYSKNILHPKYQEWVAAATIYEYLDTGICKVFEGPNGAYKFYEEQLMSKQILGSLASIKHSVDMQGDRIIASQNYIRSQIDTCIGSLDSIKHSVDMKGDRIIASQNYIRSQIDTCNKNLYNYKFNTYGY